ncbi:MAG TPA: sigma-54 dependent transcriptional regulator [Dongiaceae bacterium]|nr:sigma-54 dependent transcriptional regulator [Dongiaceae bacterium]
MNDKVAITLLYVEDEPDLRERIRIVLEMYVTRVIVAANGKEGIELFERYLPDVVVSDIKMPVMDGLELTKRIRNTAPDTPVILTTAFTETDYLLKAIELGVAAYVRKPLDCRDLVEQIIRAATPILQKAALEEAKKRGEAPLELLLGDSPAMHDVILQAQRIAETDFSVLILGETGVGKSHLAALIHGLSRRRHNPFITVTVGSMPESLVESQLFGHIKGAFTGAITSKSGLFEEAQGGTLFLDDIDCASPAIQAKILHVVEQKNFYPLGGTKRVDVDTRIISACNHDLLLEARKGNFREDLYYRLSDMVITLPPLRERGGDIAVLARTFLHEVSLELDRIPPRITSDAILLLNRHPWPGNLRELKSVMKRAALFAEEALTSEYLAKAMAATSMAPIGENPVRTQTLEELKCQAIQQALAATDGKKMEAARLLDINYSSFKRMLEKYGL